jgi:glycosyltransferase involved in cell wall biosynthesis
MKILFVYNTKASWALNDFNLLSKHFNVTDCFISSLKSTLKEIIPHSINKYDIVIFWFASLSFLPILFVSWILKRKLIIIAGGYDVVKLPSIHYGAFSESWARKLLRKFMFIVSDKIVSVSYSNQKEAFNNVKIPISKSVMIYHGFKDSKMFLKHFQERKRQVVTIGAINNGNYLRKGYKYYLELAQSMPDWKFIHIGQVSSDFHYVKEFQACQNLNMLGFLPEEKFNETLNESKFYLQLSTHEGFGCSIVDAAIMGCYPIVYDMPAMPEVVAGCGEIIKFMDMGSVKRAISELENSDINVESIRSHYLAKYPEKLREEKLVELITSFRIS